MMYDLAKAVTGLSFWEKTLKFAEEVATAVIKERSLSAGGRVIAEKIDEVVDEITELYDTVTSLINNSNQIFAALKNALAEWVSVTTSATIQGAYQVGKLLFEVVIEVALAIATGGGSAIRSFVTKVMKALNPANLDYGKIASNIKGVITDAANKARSSKVGSPAWRRIKICDIFKNGCFVKDTPVLMASNPFKNVVPAVALAGMPLVAPIQDVQVDDMVKAYHHEELYLTASNEDDIYVSGWQDYDYLDITSETWQVGKFIITEEDGNQIEVEVNRPKEWFQKREVKEIGDVAFLYMPDVNIIGDAELIEFRSTDVDTRILKLNESGQVDRPVISTFRRFSPIVFDYSFSDGSNIGATSEHPFYSVDRQDYIPIGELQEGELVKSSSDKEVRFIGGKLRDKGESVYNFEVWREHNYYVSGNKGEDFLLVHNTYWGGTFKYGSKVQKAIDHIWDGHSFAKRQPGVKSYFDGAYNTKGKIKTLVQDAIAKGKGNFLEQSDGSFLFQVEMAEFIGKNTANNSTRMITVIMEGTRVRNSFPGVLVQGFKSN